MGMERKGMSDEDSGIWQVRQALEQWKEQLGTETQMGIPLSTNGLYLPTPAMTSLWIHV